MLPVLAHAGWQVEPSGPTWATGCAKSSKSGNGDTIFHCVRQEELCDLLHRELFNYGNFTEIEAEDGCE